MNQLFSTWWATKSEHEKADLESSFVIVLSILTFLPAVIIALL
jgi:hypothetical protein